MASAVADGPGTQSPEPWFAVPRPIRNLFDLFPLRVLASEELPARAPAAARRRAALYVFADDGEAALGNPSYNPSCLKWQVCFCFLSFFRGQCHSFFLFFFTIMKSNAGV